MTDFVKIGNTVSLKSQGLDYSLKVGRCYNLMYNHYEDYTYLACDGELKLPKKIYGDTGLKDRILKTYNNSDKSVGILLEGLKGSGKTLFSKVLAKESGLPIIIVQDDYPIWKAAEFFAKVTQPVAILLDEVEKNGRTWPTDKLLKLLDGVQGGPKKLTIMTCNNANELDDNLKDRCSRIRYYIKYDGLDLDAIKDIVKDVITTNVDKNQLANTIFKKVKVLSYDNIITICDEINLFPDLSFSKIIDILNIETR